GGRGRIDIGRYHPLVVPSLTARGTACAAWPCHIVARHRPSRHTDLMTVRDGEQAQGCLSEGCMTWRGVLEVERWRQGAPMDHMGEVCYTSGVSLAAAGPV